MRNLYLSFCLLLLSATLLAQVPVPVGSGSYASYAPLSESKSSVHGGCQAYQTEHRRLYLPDSLLSRLSAADGSRQGTLALPSNDWWTYALVNDWTGKLWFYPGWAEATDAGITVGYPTYWEPTGSEMKWDTPLSVTGGNFRPKEALVDAWSDYHMSFILQDGTAWMRTTCVHGSPLVWIEAEGVTPVVTNPDATKYAVYTTTAGTRTYVTIGLISDGLSAQAMQPYAFRIPRHTTIGYTYSAQASSLTTTFAVRVEDVVNNTVGYQPVLQGFLPHHYYNTTYAYAQQAAYQTPRGTMRIAQGNNFSFAYTVHGMLPFFPAPKQWPADFDSDRMHTLIENYAAQGTFGADTYWGGKGLTQMMHYMTFALQMGDTANYRLAKKRLKENLINWYTYTPGEKQYYFARFPRFGALVGFDPSYDSDTFNDHHFHYGYFVYASAVLCMLDDDFRQQYGAMAREVARDYANWQRGAADEPWFRTLDPYCGHSFAGGMGNQGNGNGQESSSEAMQGWGGVWMLGAALGDQEMLEAGIFGYTLEARATAEYWFDRNRRNIDYSKYTHPYCCNLTMQGVGWWTWFSGDPVWMHSIQWLPISPVLTNYLSEDLTFARYDYTEMYTNKEVGNYEAATGGLGDESGLGNVCLSYLSLFDPDSAARVFDRMWTAGKAIARNTDTGGITYWLAHTHRSLGEKRYDILSDYALAAAYTNATSGITTYAVYNTTSATKQVRFWNGAGVNKTFAAPANCMTLFTDNAATSFPRIEDDTTTVVKDSIAAAWSLPYPNIALHKPATVSSYENAGCLPVNATDGDLSTRWGSAHNDNEQIVVDLQGQYYVDYLIIRWEAAYASKVEVAISSDSITWQTQVLSGTGGAQTIEMGSRGRYLRLVGLQRATIYGTSLYEFEAYGLPLNGDPTELLGLAITSTQASLLEGETPQYTVYGYNCNGAQIAVSPAITTNITADTYTITATQGNLQASYSWPILESVQIVGTEIRPKEVSIPVGSNVDFTIKAVDQFGYEADSYTETYQGTAEGDYQIILTIRGMQDTAVVHVLSYSNMNLALGKTVTASSYENGGSVPANAVDGNQTTRWSSTFNDNEWIEVDLGDCYMVDSVRLVWETAYATAYDVMLSSDGTNYTVAYAVTGATGGTQAIHFAPQQTQYVRVLCKTRNTNYGSSLWEMEVYGDGRCPASTTSLSQPAEQTLVEKFVMDGHLYIRCGSVVYDALGRVVK